MALGRVILSSLGTLALLLTNVYSSFNRRSILHSSVPGVVEVSAY